MKAIKNGFNRIMKVIDFVIMNFKYFMLLSLLFILFHFLYMLGYPEVLDTNGVQIYFKGFFSIVFIGFIINTYARVFFPEKFVKRSGFIVKYLYYIFVFLAGVLYLIGYYFPKFYSGE